jgi:predicted nucleic acid-binding protein
MTRLVLDASVVLKWFGTKRERHRARALRLRDGYLTGEIHVIAPSPLFVEVLNVAARKWWWSSSAMLDLAQGLGALGIESLDPSITDVAVWASKGLTAYDAVYVALAEEQQARLVTDDQLILEAAGEAALPLARWSGP